MTSFQNELHKMQDHICSYMRATVHQALIVATISSVLVCVLFGTWHSYQIRMEVHRMWNQAAEKYEQPLEATLTDGGK